MGKVGAVKFRPFLILSKKAGTLFLIQPPSHYRDSPRGALGTGFPRPLASLRSGRFGKKAGTLFLIQPPSHYRDSPRGALGTGFPRPLASLRSGRFGKKGRNFVPYSTPPVTIVTAPEGIIICGFCKSRCSLELCACSARWCREGRR